MRPIPSGLLDGHIEFFQDYYLKGGAVHPITDMDAQTADLLEQDLQKHPEAIKAMEAVGIKSREMQLEVYARHRFGGLDGTPDLTSVGNVNPEYRPCENRHNCPFCRKLCCRPVAPNGTLTIREMEVINLIVDDLPDKQIADMVGISINTMAVHRRNIERKIGANTKVGITRYAIENNIV